MPTSKKFSVNRLNQRGIAPVILVIILTVVIAGVAGVVYNSRKQINLKSDKTSESTEVKSTPAPTPDKYAVSEDKSGALSTRPYKSKDQKSKSAKIGMPQFSFRPPSGWNDIGSSDDIVLEYVSPNEDKISEGVAWLTLKPNVVVFAVEKKSFENLDAVFEASKSDLAKVGQEVTRSEKVKVNNEEAYYIESILDIGRISKSSLEAQIRQEIAKSGKKVSEQNLQKDLDKLLKQAKFKIIGYLFYKNGYVMSVSGKALESFWASRGIQIKNSIDTFKFE